MSKRKRGPKDDRRRPAIEINLLAEDEGTRYRAAIHTLGATD